MIALLGCSDRGLNDLDTFTGEDRVEHAGELGVPVADQECELWHLVAEVHERIAGLLGHPVCDGMRGDAENADPAVDAACWPTVGSTHPI
jgi:hypothetical protein